MNEGRKEGRKEGMDGWMDGWMNNIFKWVKSTWFIMLNYVVLI